MFKRIIEAGLQRQEETLGASLDYTRYVLERSWGVFGKLIQLARIAAYRRHCPASVWHIAAISAVRGHDCGECLQMAVNLALKAGVSQQLVAAAANGRHHELPEDLRRVSEFATRLVVDQVYDEEARRAIEASIGEAAFMELALGLGLAGVFPTIKRALGFAQSCSAVRLSL